MYRTAITIKDINAQIDRLNRITNSPAASSFKDEHGQFHTNVGNYYLSQAYGGCQVQRIVNKHGAADHPITGSHVPKRECFITLVAFIEGFEAARVQAWQEAKTG
jgi:hypothetical protein